ncbi:hypothetical protein pdam_00016345 [Pocillopora damicornis]|uniref:Uncharacterized protein n=1 Tax=Pocillopora damicornis TaxID=46731 RepID=A0A3M6TTR6_POCDA|nr:hypothetical protein pdam_00016345 [Pocillopora damicornis]
MQGTKTVDALPRARHPQLLLLSYLLVPQLPLTLLLAQRLQAMPYFVVDSHSNILALEANSQYLDSGSTKYKTRKNVRTTGYGVTSLTTNSRTLKVGDNMAHCRAQPRATASSAFRVVLTSLSKSAFITSLTAGIRYTIIGQCRKLVMITEFPTDKPLELAHGIFQIEYHLLIHMDIVSIKRYHDFFV